MACEQRRPLITCALLAIAGLLGFGATSGTALAQARDPDDAVGLRGSVRAPSNNDDAAAELNEELFNPRPALSRDTPEALPPGRSATRRPVRARVQGNAQARVRADVRTTRPPEQSPPPPPRRRRPPEEDPYGPLGWRLGGVTLFPSVQVDTGYDSNPMRTAPPTKGSVVLRGETELRVQSDWERHELTGILRGSYDDFPDVSEANRPAGEGRLRLRLDALRDTQIIGETRFSVTTQLPGNPNLPSGVVNQPLLASVGATLGAVQNFNRLSVGLYGDVDRYTYGDAKLADGTTQGQSFRNYNQFTARLRTGYELMQGLTPYVEGLVDTRRHDDYLDDSGYARDSKGVGVRVGAAVDLTSELKGEAAAGYGVRTYEDPRLGDLRGPIGEASLVWTATPLTTVRLKGSSSLNETTVVGSSGMITRQAGIEVNHALRRYLTLTAALDVVADDYKDVALKDRGYTGSVRLDWKLTRSLSVRASFTHARLNSTSAGSDYTANVFLIGLRLQR